MNNSGQNLYAPLPFSYLTGGGATDRRPTGLKKSVSQENGVNQAGLNLDPYSIYAGRPNDLTAKRKVSIDIIDPQLDVTDPYLLSTGHAGGSQKDIRNSYSDDPRYNDGLPSANDGGNVFFRASESGDNSARCPRPGENLLIHDPNTMSLQRTGHTNHALDTRDEENQGKKLPRFKVTDDGGYHYYSGANGSLKPEVKPESKLNTPMDNASNPIWDKYYATGGLAPGYESKPQISPISPGVRPTTKQDDFNNLIRTSGSSDAKGGTNCLKTKRGAVLCAVLVTAFLCLAGGFIAGWFIYGAVYPVTATTNTTVATGTTLPAAGVSQTTMKTTSTSVAPTPASPVTTAVADASPTTAVMTTT